MTSSIELTSLCLPYSRDGIKSAPAKKAFFTTDVVGQTYLCYLVPSKRQLLYSRLEKTNASERLIFGITAGVPAVDAAPIVVSHTYTM